MDSAAYVLWGIGGICGVLGLIRLNALGPSPVARALGFLPMVGFAAFVAGDGLRLLGFIGPADPLYNVLATTGWITVLAGMLVVSILTIAAKTWQGWQRFLPLAATMMLPLAMVAGAATGSFLVSTVVGWLPWLLLGYVIAAARPVPTLEASVTG